MSDIQEEQKRLYKRAEENDIKLLQEKIDSLESQLDFMIDRNDEKQDRINKAISYIENEMSHLTTNGIRTRKHLLNILQGSDKE